MNIEKKELNPFHESITITLEHQDYSENVEKSLRQLRKKVVLKGFRPGNAPMSLVNKLYRKSVLFEEIEKLLQEKIMAYINENKIDTIGTPIITENNLNEIEFTENPTISVTFEYGLRPEVKINLNKRNKVNFYKIKVAQEDIDKYLDYYKKTYGQQVKKDEVTEKAIISGKVYETPENEEKKYYNENATIVLSNIKKEKVKKFIGKKVGDIIQVDPYKLFNEKKDVAFLLGMKEEELPEKLNVLNFEITDITEFEEAEINQDLWDKIYGKDVVTSYDQFIEKIREEIEKARLADSEYFLNLQLKDKLIEKSEIELPIEFLKKQLKHNYKDFKEEDKTYFDVYLNAIKEQLIYSFLQKQHDIKITPEDLLEGAKEVVIAQFKQYGIYQLPDNYLEEMAQKLLKNEKEADKIMERKLEQKIIEIAKSLVTLEEKEVTYEEFINIVKQYNKH